MRCLLVVVVGAALAQADWGFEEEDDVVVLSPETHARLLEAREEVLVYYHLPRCEHCVKFDDDYSQLALSYKEGDRRVPLAKLDCNLHLTFCRQLGVPTFPFFKLFIRGHPLVYYGERTPAGLKGFVDNALNRAPLTLPLEQLPARLQEGQLSVIFAGRKSKRGYHLLDLLSKYDRKAAFFHVEASPELSHHALFEALGEFELEGRHIVFEGRTPHLCAPATTFELLENCIADVRHPAVMELGHEVSRFISASPQRWMILFVRDGEDTAVADFTRFAQNHRQAMKFVLAQDDTPNAALLQRFKDALLVTADESLPKLFLVDSTLMLEGAVRYRFEGTLSYTTLRAFYRRVLDKSLSPVSKTEDFDARPLGTLTAISGRSFDQYATSSAADALVLYHAELENCSASRELLAALEPLTAAPANQGVGFFAFNADRNDLRVFHSQQRPLLLLFGRRDPGLPRVYTGPAQAEQLQAFIDSRKTLVRSRGDFGSLTDEL